MDGDLNERFLPLTVILTPERLIGYQLLRCKQDLPLDICQLYQAH